MINMHTWMTNIRDLMLPPLRMHNPVSPRSRPDHGKRTERTDVVLAPTASTVTAPEPVLRLHLFGPLRASVGGRVAIDEHFTRRKAKALLALLYLERGRYIPRDELIERIWPNVDELTADSGRLKQTALVLRRALEGDHSRRTGWHYIVERDGTYYFNTQVAYKSDLEDFEHELKQSYADRQVGNTEGALAHFQRAFALRRSELLPEFRYDDWASSHVGAEREQYLQALEDAARLHGAHGDDSRAIELLKRAAREDPLRESSAMQLMEWLSLRRNKTEALRVYARLRDALASKLQLEPDPKITALYHAIRRDRSAGDLHEPGLSAAS
jgi:LuxR family maltose regulon positive regulatory protein